ncbi:MAG: cation transporter [Defluviitaleaceae bacterium]|nr:cation transporter [Defluviitaleaceae bacterium]MCL2836282.1 cation transporter [Defluviitaleaceae bacterium]
MQSVIKIEGMSCSHCENAVKEAILRLSGVSQVIVSLKEKNAAIIHNGRASMEDFKNVIEELGFDVIST